VSPPSHVAVADTIRSLGGLTPPARLLAPLLLLAAGCADCQFLRRACPPPVDPRAAANAPAPDANYRVGCPDVLDVAFLDRPEWDALVSVDLDGRLPLGEPGRPRAEGLTVEQVREEVARVADVPADRVHVRLAAPRSSHVYLHGPIRGRTRAIPYQGPEPVIDFLKRVGGLPPGSKLSEVYVVRPNVAAGGRPEVFRVDVEAVLLDNDQATNVPVRPSDQVYVGETHRSSFSRLLPDWLRPLYRKLIGLVPEEWRPFARERVPARPLRDSSERGA
jgi:protein involved in polysaccharide export with SLBB domain